MNKRLERVDSELRKMSISTTEGHIEEVNLENLENVEN
jgi:hypothetical protein